MNTRNLYVQPKSSGYGTPAVTLTTLPRYPGFLGLLGRPTTYRVELGEFSCIGYTRGSDLAEVTDRRLAKKIARRQAQKLGMVPQKVFRRRWLALCAAVDA